MSTINPKTNKFSLKLSKNTVSANRIAKTDKNDEGAKTTSREQSTSDDVLTRYDYDSNYTLSNSFYVFVRYLIELIFPIFLRMAIEEIVKETAKGAIRAEQVGPSGWLPCPLMKTNKRFLRNTIKSVISHNRNKVYKPKKSEVELDEIIKRGQKRKPKFGDRKHCFRRPNVDRTDGSGKSRESK